MGRASPCLNKRSPLIASTHANGIHEYVLADSTRAAYDDFLVYLEAMFRDAPRSTAMRTRINLTNGLPPLQYAFRQTREFMETSPRFNGDSRTALLYQPGAVISLVQSFISLIGSKTVGAQRFFSSDQRDDAIAWLLGNDV